MAERISELESAALDEKPWQLTGEVTAQTRPENSMLEEDISFDQATRMGVCLFALCLSQGQAARMYACLSPWSLAGTFGCLSNGLSLSHSSSNIRETLFCILKRE